MKCPYCGNKLQVLPRCYYNAETYRTPVTARTNCCGKLVNIKTVTEFVITKDTSSKTEDDWGLEISN